MSSPYVEYELVKPDGTKAYEIVDKENEMPVMQQINLCMKLHGAISAHPVQGSLFQEPQSR